MVQGEKGTQKLLGVCVEQELMNYIQETPIEIGERIPNEFVLAEKFGVGRSTIREAVKTLTSQGILEVRRGRGTFVVRTTKMEENPFGIPDDVDKVKLALDLLEVRMMLEPQIAMQAAAAATDEEIEQVKALCNEVERLCRDGMDYIPKDMEFHACIAKMSKNQIVESLIPMITNAVLTFANVTKFGLKEETLETHRLVVKAIENRDSKGAEVAMIMHLGYNRDRILDMVQEERKRRKTE